MTFKDFILLEAFIAQYSAVLSEHVIDDLEDIKTYDKQRRIDILSRLLFYIKMHSGSAGNTDLKLFYTDASIEDKVSQIETTIKNHQDIFDTITREVTDKFQRRKQHEIYSAIDRFFSNRARVPAGMQV